MGETGYDRNHAYTASIAEGVAGAVAAAMSQTLCCLCSTLWSPRVRQKVQSEKSTIRTFRKLPTAFLAFGRGEVGVKIKAAYGQLHSLLLDWAPGKTERGGGALTVAFVQLRLLVNPFLR